MLKAIKNFFKEEDGMGTVEIVIIIAILVTIAIVFRKAITSWVSNTVEKLFSDATPAGTVDT